MRIPFHNGKLKCVTYKRGSFYRLWNTISNIITCKNEIVNIKNSKYML